MLVEITKVSIEEEGVVIEAISLEEKCSLKNLFKEVEPERLSYLFTEENFGICKLDEIVGRIYACKEKKTLGDKILALEGLRTILLPDKFLEK